jgi:hypothetical protein
LCGPATAHAHSPDGTYRWVGDEDAPGAHRAGYAYEVTGATGTGGGELMIDLRGEASTWR